MFDNATLHAVRLHPRLLLLEDDPSLQRMVELEFAGSSYSLDYAQDGEEALRLYRRSMESGCPCCRYALIVLDGAVPKLSGFEVAQAIREDDDETPLALWTADADPLSVSRAKMLQAHFWPKSGDLPLRQCVDELLSAAE